MYVLYILCLGLPQTLVYAALLLGPCGAGTLASRAGGLRPPWVAFGHMGAPCGRIGAFSSYPVQISQIRDGKSTLRQPALIVSDPVQISHICDGKSPLSQPALIMSDPVQISQICDGKSPLSQPALIAFDPVQVSQIRDGKSPPSQPAMIVSGPVQIY